MSRLQAYLGKTPDNELDSAAVAYLAALDHVEKTAPNIAAAIEKELADQRSHLKLIASENFCSLATQLAMGNLLTDKYSEGSPFHRFYAGCENVDTVEAEAAQLLKDLFGAEHAYVQPHSGADANMVAFWAILATRVQNPELQKLGAKSIDTLSAEEYERIRQLMINQKVMGMSLNAGGHLTHGYRHNVSAKMMQAVTYDVDPKTERLDYDQLAEQVKKERPTLLLAGYSAYPRLIDFARMREIADSVGATFMVDMAHFSGLVAGKALTGNFDPVPHAHVCTSTTHKALRGPRGGFVLCTEEFKEMVDKGCPMVLGGPLPHVMAAKAVAFREASTPEYQAYAKQVIQNAASLAESLMKNNLRLTTGGTENHLVIADVSHYGITGRQAELALREAGLTVNRNAIPYDQNGPWYTSGIRVGTPAVTTLGMGSAEMTAIGSLIVKVLESVEPATVEKTGKPSKAKYRWKGGALEEVRAQVADLLQAYPLYPEIPLGQVARPERAGSPGA